jgi:cell wall-associated NlpC family hydrolase
MWACRTPVLAASALATALACAAPRGLAPALPPPAPPEPPRAVRERLEAVRVAESLVGAPYRPGGATPRGFDCSGLVVYSFARVGVHGLPRSAEELELATAPVELADLEPGDLLFFRIDGRKTSHVALYVGEREFVHAPSRGKRVERIDFDHVYWGPRLARAGRLIH